MATVVNNPGDASGESSGMGMVLGIILAVVVIGAFVVYALPAIQGNQSVPAGTSTDVNVTVPTSGGGGSTGSTPAPVGGGLY